MESNVHSGENPDKIETVPAKSPSKRGGWRPTFGRIIRGIVTKLNYISTLSK